MHKLHGIFAGLVFDHEPTLGEVVKEAGWGSNGEIRQKGFRVDIGFNWTVPPFFSQRVKDMPRINSPKAIIRSGEAVLVPKGDKVIVITVES